MRRGLIKFTKGLLAILPFIGASCMINSDGDIPDFNQQLQKDIAAIDSYLAANNIIALKDNSGLRYLILRSGTGNQPTIDSCVTSNYQGILMSSGLQFDKGTNISFPLVGVIDGWKIGIPLLHEGDSATLYIPSGLAYGFIGIEPEIPKNANLIFHIGLKKVGRTYRTSNSVSSCN